MMDVYCKLTLFILLAFSVSTCFGFDEELRRTGELRKGCVTWGNAPQPARRVNTTSRLRAIRRLMASEVILGTMPVQAYIVTSTDEHQSVEVDEYERRREYISGFSGSYGDAIITMNKAALWTDGRYHLQADEQMNCDWLLMREGHRNIPTRSEWLKTQFPQGGRVGVNPKLLSEYLWRKFEMEFQGSGLELVALNVSLIDMIWPENERGRKRSKDAFVLDEMYSGENYTSKVARTRNKLEKLGADAMVVTALDEVAWLLNIRGRDVPLSPYVRAYIILDMQNIFLYVSSSQLIVTQVIKYLKAENSALKQKEAVQVVPYDDIWKDLRIKPQLYKKILAPSHCVYSEGASHAVYEHIFSEKILYKPSPVVYLKAVKNPTEIQNMRKINVRDAAAMCECFAYIEKRMKAFLDKLKDNEEITEGDKVTELEVAEILDNYRYEQELSLGNSFRTIVAFASNGAQPHYEPTEKTNTIIFNNSTLILDSGGQYYAGTTDVTRTLHFGEPTELMKEAYTRVLLGIMRFSTLTFPDNTRMADADALARGPLWEVGLDYLHETGHGIGAFLGVRESPISVQYDSDISARESFKQGYFLTTEPGYYQEGYFGVRLENVLEVVEKPSLKHPAGHTFLGFRTLTLVPFEPKLIKLSLLSTHDRKWLNEYNKEVQRLVGAELKRQHFMDGFNWMKEKTKHIPEYGQSNLITSQPIVVLGILLVTFILF